MTDMVRIEAIRDSHAPGLQRTGAPRRWQWVSTVTVLTLLLASLAIFAAQDVVAAGGERWIDVDRGAERVTLYIGAEPQESFWAAMGWEQSDDGFYATANGTYYVYAKNQALTWTPWAQAYVTDWVAFDPDRFNGFHAYTMDAAGNVLSNGTGPTGGCVALAPWAAEQLFDFADYGTRVEVHW